jgi:gliding motility-associated-like protein
MRLLFILFCLFCLANKQYAQNIKDGWIYSDSGQQVASRCHIDKVGNRYQVVTYLSDFKVDSNGHPVIIRRGFPTINSAIIKFNSFGSYQFHINLPSKNIWNNFDIKFTSTNEAILCYYFPQVDSINLIDSKGVFFKKIVPPFYNTSNASLNSAILLCKLDTNGRFVWANTIARENPKLYHNGSVIVERFSINNSDEISVFFPNNSTDTTFNYDTLAVINNNNQKSLHPVNTKYVLVKFNSAGNLIAVKEPLKNLFLHQQPDLYNLDFKTINSVTDGTNTYSAFRFTISKPDTLQMGDRQPLGIGNHYLLMKFNENDSIVWIKKILREIFLIYRPLIRLDFDTVHKTLALSAPYNPFSFDFYLNPSFSVSNSGAYVCKINQNGNIIWEDFFAGIEPEKTIITVNFNYITNQLQLIGYPNVNDFKLQRFISSVYNDQLNAVIACIDNSTNTLVAAQAFAVNNLNNSFNSPLLIGISQFYMGSPITDNKGRTYISGAFADSITLPCKKFYALIENLPFSYAPLTDAFVLVSEPFFKKDTGVCTMLLSPSGKYIWDSTGTYTDTLTNSLGCDSIVFFHVKVLQSKSELDSTVCISLPSFSGRYLWDSTGTYFDTIPNAFGCDSIIKLNLTIKPNKLTIDTTVKYSFISPSGKYIWDSSGIYRDTLTSSSGCDSVITINLKVLSTKNSIDTFNCNPIKYFSSSKWINNSGIYLDTIPNSIGGDSLLTIHFVLGSSQSIIDTMFCSEIISPSGKFVLSQSGIYTDTLVNQFFCDSIITVNFTRTATTDTLKFEQCDSLLLPSGKLKVGITGKYTDTLTTINGCDSILIINYTNLTSYSQLLFSICDSSISPSGKFIYRSSGTYIDTLMNNNGCDSLITINIQKSAQKITISKSNDIDCNNTFAILNAEGALTYKWMPTDGLSDANSNNPIATPKNSITYYLSATDSFGCEFTDSIFINVKLTDSLGFFPNIFTPNGDNVNDCLPMNSLSEFKDINFIVFNRWGSTIFETTDTKLCWQGLTNNGQELSEGVYFYILKGITKCGHNLSLHGTITIIR